LSWQQAVPKLRGQDACRTNAGRTEFAEELAWLILSRLLNASAQSCELDPLRGVEALDRPRPIPETRVTLNLFDPSPWSQERPAQTHSPFLKKTGPSAPGWTGISWATWIPRMGGCEFAPYSERLCSASKSRKARRNVVLNHAAPALTS